MARKADLRQVDAIAREFGLDRREFGDYLHELKRSGDRGSEANGDFTTDELRERARMLHEERDDGGSDG